MTELSPDARRLVDAARQERLPLDARERILEGLKTRIAQGPPPPTPRGPLAALKVPLGLVSAALVVAGVVALRAPRDNTHPQPPSVHVPTTTHMASSPSVVALPTPPPAPAGPARVEAPATRVTAPASGASEARAPRLREDPVGVLEEAALLRRARSASSGAGSLALLDGYDRRFPRGALQAEAWLLRVRVLCMEHRPSEARRWGQRVLQAHPGSPAATAVGATCAVTP
ncbi:MAG: hypothetical protein HY909_13200 [Deltaproteobacteria bacterium]|nr:hypothetical protein [Deltaproteobacteria bacterium]